MSSGSIKILLVEDNPGDARLIREELAEVREIGFEIDWVTRLAAGLERLNEGGIDLVLLDLDLPDSRGLDTFITAAAQAPRVPFVVLTGLDNGTLALNAVQKGAQDYLVKGRTDGELLLRTIRYATERKKIEEDLRRAHDEMERRVAERTAELAKANEELQSEILQRRQAERALQLAHDDLELKVARRTAELARANAWMRQENEERRAAEMALEAERQRLFALLDGLPGLVYLKAADYSIRFANRLFRDICGDWEGKKCYEAIFKSGQPCQNCTQSRILETGEPTVKEAAYPESNQVYQIYSYPFADVDGAPLVLTLGIDITRRKQIEEKLRQSEARLAKAHRLAHLGHWEWDLQNGKVLWSEEMYRIFGLEQERFAPSLEAVMSYVHPEDQDRVSKSINDAWAGVRPYNVVNRIIRPDGSVRHIHSQAEVLLNKIGQPRRMLGTAQDITERRLAEMRLRDSEARFRAIFEGAAVGIGLTDMAGRFLTANKTFQDMVGYGEEELSGQTCLGITHPDDLGMSLELFRELESGQREHLQMQKRFRRKDGPYFWARVTVSLVKNSEGRPMYAVGMVEDVTQAKKAEERLQESEKRLRYLASQLMTAQEDERKRISRELHDELGQSLLVLKLQARAIERGLGPEQHSLLGECREMLANFDQVVDNVRRLSRDLSPTILEDLGLTAALQVLVREFSKRYHIEYCAQETNIDDLFPLDAQVTIYRIFQESLTNIGKHSRATLLTVTISKTEDRVSFLIQDNGIGFKGQRRRRDTDRGLGLASMEERARMVGGVLSVWSQEGAGAKISFDIPFSPKDHRHQILRPSRNN